MTSCDGSSYQKADLPFGTTMISILIAARGAYCCFLEERLFGNQFGALHIFKRSPMYLNGSYGMELDSMNHAHVEGL